MSIKFTHTTRNKIKISEIIAKSEDLRFLRHGTLTYPVNFGYFAIFCL